MAMAPAIAESTREEREAYVQKRYQCIADCDACGLCKLFHGKSAEVALQPYVDGEIELPQLLMSYRHR